MSPIFQISWWVCTILVLIMIFWQDFKYRGIHWMLFPVLGILLLVDGILKNDLTYYSMQLLGALFFIGLQLFVLAAYIRLTRGCWSGFTKRYIGLGDILFWICACLSFSLVNFVAYFMVSTLFALILHVICQQLPKYNQKSIPLAGFQSVPLIAVFILEKLTQLDRYLNITNYWMPN